MAFSDWLLALHVLAAFSLVAAEVLFTVLIVGSRNLDAPGDVVRLFRLGLLGDVLFTIGTLGVLVFGIWLAVDSDEYGLLDGWVIAAIVLWAVLAEVGRRTGKVYYAARDRAKALAAEGRTGPEPELRTLLRAPRGLALHTASVVLVVALLAVMVYKPGA